MGRYKEAPWGYECPYKNACPHLGMSTTWATLLLSDVEEDSYRDGHAWVAAQKELKALEEENKRLRARVAELESRLKQQHRMRFKPNKTRSTPKEESTAGGKIPRTRGAPPGHPPWHRAAPQRVDRSVSVPPPTICPHCQREGLASVDKEHVQIQEDIVLQPRTVVTRYVHQLAYCPTCGRDVFQTAEGELRNCSIGPVTKATAVYLRHEVKLSYRDIQKVFSGLFGMPFVPASAMAFSHRTAEQGMHLYEDLRTKIHAARIVHGDETSWRIDGNGAYLWYAGNNDVAFYHVDRSRSSEVAVSIFGSAFSGYLVADSYAAYNAINPKRRQACLSHLKRTSKEIRERIKLLPAKQQDARTLRFCKALNTFFSICCRIHRKRTKGTLSFSTAKKLIPRLQGTLDTICRLPLADHDAENLRTRITHPSRDGPNLFTFLIVNGMPPTNNHAEQALRLPVIFRKISFGSRSLFGAQAMATNLSLLATAKRQQRDPIQLFKTLLLHGRLTPLSTLYDPANIPTIDSS
jgi:transposase